MSLNYSFPRICPTCNLIQEQDKYYPSNPWLCKSCTGEYNKRWKSNHKDGSRNHKLMYHYGITLIQYNDMFTKQEGKCSICQRHQSEFKKTLEVDHCHQTNKIRSLLCQNCNKALGLLYDDLGTIQRMANYLIGYKNVL